MRWRYHSREPGEAQVSLDRCAIILHGAYKRRVCPRCIDRGGTGRCTFGLNASAGRLLHSEREAAAAAGALAVMPDANTRPSKSRSGGADSFLMPSRVPPQTFQALCRMFYFGYLPLLHFPACAETCQAKPRITLAAQNRPLITKNCVKPRQYPGGSAQKVVKAKYFN